MNRMNVCGNCKYYDEWENGYCNWKKAEVEPEDASCSNYASFDTGFTPLFIEELPKSVVTLIISLAEAYYKEQYPDMEIDEIRDKTSDLENEKIKDVIPLLQEYTDELYERS